MIKYRAVIAYDGHDFFGWQDQQYHKMTVTQVLQDTFAAVFNHKVSIIGASRTDAGVHALGQVALLRTALDIPEHLLLSALQNRLPKTIYIRSLQRSHDIFHPYHGVDSKRYYYHFTQKRPLPFMARYAWHHVYPLNLELLQKALQVFVGTHDFRSFCSGDYSAGETIRTIQSIKLSFVPRYAVYRIEITGKSFLRYMIRRLVGAALFVAAGKVSLERMVDIMKSCNPEHSLPKAPALGLLLRSIIYKN